MEVADDRHATPSLEACTIPGTAAAAASVFTVTRTSSEPARARATTWIDGGAASAVSVLVIDWTTTGWALPTGMPPIRTVTVGRRPAQADLAFDRRRPSGRHQPPPGA